MATAKATTRMAKMLFALHNRILQLNKVKTKLNHCCHFGFCCWRFPLNRYILELQCPLTRYSLYLQLEETMTQIGQTSRQFLRYSYENLIAAAEYEIHNRYATIPDTAEQMETNIRYHVVIYIQSFFGAKILLLYISNTCEILMLSLLVICTSITKYSVIIQCNF